MNSGKCCNENDARECSKLKSTTPLENLSNEDIDMADLEENLFAGNIASSPSESMRTKDLSQRQRDVLQNIINQTPRGNLSC